MAEETYGAAFRNDGTIDRTVTAFRRSDMKRRGLPVDEPVFKSTVPPPPPTDDGRVHPPENLTEEERVALAMTCRCCS